MKGMQGIKSKFGKNKKIITKREIPNNINES